MKNSPSRHPLARIFLVGLIASLFLFGPRAGMRADPAPKTNAPAATNAPPAAASDEAAKPHSLGATITVSGDDDDDTVEEKGTKHLETIRIGGNHGDSSTLSDLIPILGILATFGTPLLIVLCVSYFSYRRRAETLALAREYLNKGMPVPAELLDATSAKHAFAGGKDTGNCCPDLRKGFKLTFIGLGVTLALYVFDPHGTDWAWGLIPMVMGIGYLISGWFESRIQGKPPEGPPTTRPPGNPL